MMKMLLTGGDLSQDLVMKKALFRALHFLQLVVLIGSPPKGQCHIAVRGDHHWEVCTEILWNSSYW